MSLAAFAPSSFALLNIPSDGSDGALIVASNLVIDLSQAVTGVWSNNNAGNIGKGIYDSNKWAVVFKYSSVTISNGATVTFANQSSRAPVVWLVSGDVTINGTVSLDGQSYANPPLLPEPGPGGFRGGNGYFVGSVSAGAGFGPGGGARNADTRGFGGSYGTQGNGGPAAYGNPSLLPLLGGSGGAGNDRTDIAISGGAGGGAILIAVAGNASISGTVRANGGAGWVPVFNPGDTSNHSGSGSGGGVRLITTSLVGNGSIQAVGGTSGSFGGVGRIRIERVSTSGTAQINPGASVVTLLDGSSPLIWLPDTGPTARIVSIGSVGAPADPRASFGAFGPDVAVPQATNTTVVVETTNAEVESQVRVRVTPRASANYTETLATNAVVINANPLIVRWTATVPVISGYSAVQVKVLRP